MANETAPKSRRPRRMARPPKETRTGTVTHKAEASAAITNIEQAEPAPPQKRPNKTARIIALLQRDDGATLDEMTDTTGWQKHTMRAALTGLRRKGHAIERGRRGEVTLLSYRTGGLTMTGRLHHQLQELETLSMADLKDRWAKLTGQSVPRISEKMLRLAIACELQTKMLGGLSRRMRQRLDHAGAAKSITSDIRPGMRLAREWNGTVHIVTIGDAGEINWNGRQWRSLSEVARAITGTRWSGPAFFGLRRKREAA